MPANSPHLLIELPCPKCCIITKPAIGPGNGPHAFRANCSSCGAFLRWLSQYTPAEREAHRQQARNHARATRPPSQPQLDCLQALGDDCPPPTMVEASERIETLKRGGK